MEAPEKKAAEEMAKTLEEARRAAEKLIEEALRRGSELAETLEKLRTSDNVEDRVKAEKFLRGEIGPEELRGKQKQ